MSRFNHPLLWLGVALLVGCATPAEHGQDTAEQAAATADSRLATPGSAVVQAEQERAVSDLNRQLLAASFSAPANRGFHEYRLGPDDVLSIEAAQVEELHGLRIRVGGSGRVALPLLGTVSLAGLTLSEAEAELNQRLRRYMHNPQVTLFVDDYRSQEITVTGAVSNPGIYPVQRPRSLFELLSLAGGLTRDAGHTINARVHMPDPDNGQLIPQSLIIDLRELLQEGEAQHLVLSGGDSIFVPEAGVFFVEGAVSKPGAYSVRGDMNLLKAIAMAGGTDWAAIDNDIRIVRRTNAQEPEVISLDLRAIRDQQADDVPVLDGDIIVVSASGFKQGVSAFFRGISGIFSFGRSL